MEVAKNAQNVANASFAHSRSLADALAGGVKNQTLSFQGETPDGKFLVFEGDGGVIGAIPTGLARYYVTQGLVTAQGEDLLCEKGFSFKAETKLFTPRQPQAAFGG